MKLSAYLQQPGRTASALALATGFAVSSITRAARGDTLPSRELMAKICEATEGQVTPNDFFDITPAGSEAQAA